MVSAVITDRDLGLKRIVANVKELNGKSVKVGVMGNQTVEGTSVIDYAMYNEFGTSRIPARPFMSETYNRYYEEMLKFVEFLAGEIIEGKTSPMQALMVIGLDYQAKVQQTIRDAVSWAAPNAPSTVKQKGSSSPLIDTGRMIGAIRYEIVK